MVDDVTAANHTSARLFAINGAKEYRQNQSDEETQS